MGSLAPAGYMAGAAIAGGLGGAAAGGVGGSSVDASYAAVEQAKKANELAEKAETPLNSPDSAATATAEVGAAEEAEAASVKRSKARSRSGTQLTGGGTLSL